jgi:uncharacterized Zn finger protein
MNKIKIKCSICGYEPTYEKVIDQAGDIVFYTMLRCPHQCGDRLKFETDENEFGPVSLDQ